MKAKCKAASLTFQSERQSVSVEGSVRSIGVGCTIRRWITRNGLHESGESYRRGTAICVGRVKTSGSRRGSGTTGTIRILPAVVVVELESGHHLSNVSETTRVSGFRTGAVQRNQNDGRQNTDNGDNDQKFDEGKALSFGQFMNCFHSFVSPPFEVVWICIQYY